MSLIGKFKLLLKLRRAKKAIEGGKMSWKTAWKALRTFGVGVLSVGLPAAALAVADLLGDPTAARALLADLPPAVQAVLILGLASLGEYIRGALKHRKKGR